MSKLILYLICLLAVQVNGQDVFRLPDKIVSPPVSYLNEFRVGDTQKRLSEKERIELCRLFIQSYIISIRNFKQDYLLNVNTPIYKLLKTNVSSVVGRENEGGIFLGSIVRELNKLPEYKDVVMTVLSENERESVRCKP